MIYLISSFYDYKEIPLHIIIVLFWRIYFKKYFQCLKTFCKQKIISYTFDDQEWFERFTFAIVIIGCGNTLTNTCVFYYYVPYITSGYCFCCCKPSIISLSADRRTSNRKKQKVRGFLLNSKVSTRVFCFFSIRYTICKFAASVSLRQNLKPCALHI